MKSLPLRDQVITAYLVKIFYKLLYKIDPGDLSREGAWTRGPGPRQVVSGKGVSPSLSGEGSEPAGGGRRPGLRRGQEPGGACRK